MPEKFREDFPEAIAGPLYDHEDELPQNYSRGAYEFDGMGHTEFLAEAVPDVEMTRLHYWYNLLSLRSYTPRDWDLDSEISSIKEIRSLLEQGYADVPETFYYDFKGPTAEWCNALWDFLDVPESEETVQLRPSLILDCFLWLDSATRSVGYTSGSSRSDKHEPTAFGRQQALLAAKCLTSLIGRLEGLNRLVVATDFISIAAAGDESTALNELRKNLFRQAFAELFTDDELNSLNTLPKKKCLAVRVRMLRELMQCDWGMEFCRLFESGDDDQVAAVASDNGGVMLLDYYRSVAGEDSELANRTDIARNLKGETQTRWQRLFAPTPSHVVDQFERFSRLSKADRLALYVAIDEAAEPGKPMPVSPEEFDQLEQLALRRSVRSALADMRALSGGGGGGTINDASWDRFAEILLTGMRTPATSPTESTRPDEFNLLEVLAGPLPEADAEFAWLEEELSAQIARVDRDQGWRLLEEVATAFGGEALRKASGCRNYTLGEMDPKDLVRPAPLKEVRSGKRRAAQELPRILARELIDLAD